jgi:hypothetical protein
LITQAQLYTYIAAFRINYKHTDNTLLLADIFELFFLFDNIIKCFREYTPENETVPVRDIRKCAWNYVCTLFFWDMVFIAPVQKFQMTNNRQFLYFLIKQGRCNRLFLIADKRAISVALGSWIFKTRNFLLNKPPENIKPFKFQYNIEEVYKFKKEKKEFVKEPVSKNDLILLTGFFVKLTKNVLTVFEVAYQAGLFFLVVCILE